MFIGIYLGHVTWTGCVFFLKRGADFQRADDFGVTPLHVDAALDYKEMLQFLLERGGAFICLSGFRTIQNWLYNLRNKKVQKLSLRQYLFKMYYLGINMNL